MTTNFNLAELDKRKIWAQENNFEYIDDPTYSQHEACLRIGNVAVLNTEKSRGKFWGVFADTALKANMILGEYLGDRVSFSDIQNEDYAFQLSENRDWAIDARLRRNWTAIVNSVSSAAEANILAYKKNNHIFYNKKGISKQDILDQLSFDDTNASSATTLEEPLEAMPASVLNQPVIQAASTLIQLSVFKNQSEKISEEQTRTSVIAPSPVVLPPKYTTAY